MVDKIRHSVLKILKFVSRNGRYFITVHMFYIEPNERFLRVGNLNPSLTSQN